MKVEYEQRCYFSLPDRNIILKCNSGMCKQSCKTGKIQREIDEYDGDVRDEEYYKMFRRRNDDSN